MFSSLIPCSFSAPKMAVLRTRNGLATIILVGVLASLLPESILGQHCDCAPGLCCSRWGYCGTSNEYCGTGCKEGPCKARQQQTDVKEARRQPRDIEEAGQQRPRHTKDGSVPEIVTEEFFNKIMDQASAGCAGKSFYSRHMFLQALKSYPRFGQMGTPDDSRREIAAFFAHVTLETGHFCYIEEINGASKDYCDENNKQYPCVAGKKYHGRGPIQISWNYNYGEAGKSIGFDGLNLPEKIGTDPLVSFKTALWYWMKNVHPIIKSGDGFGHTIRTINGPLECDGRSSETVQSRVGFYKEYCEELGVSPGENISC